MSVKQIGIWMLRFALAIAVMVLFFAWAPWLGSRSITQIGPGDIPVGGVPAWAKSFSINHGQVIFYDHASVSEAPLPFIGLTFLLVAALAGLFFSFPKHLRWRRERS